MILLHERRIGSWVDTPEIWHSYSDIPIAVAIPIAESASDSTMCDRCGDTGFVSAGFDPACGDYRVPCPICRAHLLN